MKRIKILGILAMFIVVCVTLASCGQFVPTATLEVNTDGSGTATFVMVVPKNGADDVGNNWVTPNGDSEPNNTGYLTSPDAILNLFKSKLPSGFTITMKEQTNFVDVEDQETGEIDHVDKGSFDYTITFPFSSIEDYNAKIKSWLPDKYWEAAKTAAAFETDVEEASMTVEGDAANANITFTVDMRILQVMCEWAWDICSTDTTGAVVDGGSGFDRQYAGFNMDKGTFDVNFNGKNTHKRYSATKPEIEVKATGVNTTETTTPENPGTGVPMVASVVMLGAAAAAGVMLITRKRSK